MYIYFYVLLKIFLFFVVVVIVLHSFFVSTKNMHSYFLFFVLTLTWKHIIKFGKKKTSVHDVYTHTKCSTFEPETQIKK